MPAGLGADDGYQHFVSIFDGVPVCQADVGAPFYGGMFEAGKFYLLLCPICERFINSLSEKTNDDADRKRGS